MTSKESVDNTNFHYIYLIQMKFSTLYFETQR